MSSDAQAVLFTALVLLFKWLPYAWLLRRVSAPEVRRWGVCLALGAARTLLGVGVALGFTFLVLGPPTLHGSGSAPAWWFLLFVWGVFQLLRAVEWRIALRFAPGWWALSATGRRDFVWRGLLLSTATDVVFVGAWLGVESCLAAA